MTLTQAEASWFLRLCPHCRAQGGCPRTIYYLSDKVKGRVTTLSVPFPVLSVLKSLGTLEASLPRDPSLPAPH